MFGADYVWILQESESESWWDVEKQDQEDCSSKNLYAAIENVIFVSSFNHMFDDKSISGMVRGEFYCNLIKHLTHFFFQKTSARFEEELSRMNVTKPYSRFMLTTYDAIWSIALVLKKTEEFWRNESRMNAGMVQKDLNIFDYNRIDLAEDFMKQFSRLKFQGISVNI